MFNLNILLNFCLTLMTISSVEMTFCDKYRQNSKQIDFGYRRIRRTNAYDSYLAIDRTFWRIRFEDQQSAISGKSVYVIDNDIDVQLNNRYQMAFCIYEQNGCLSAFVDKNSSTIDWIRFNDSFPVISGGYNFFPVTSTNISFQQFEPSIAFVPNFEQTKRRIVYFLEQTHDSKTWKYHRRYRYYDFDTTHNGTDVTNAIINANSPIVQKAIDHIPDDLNLIAVFGQFSVYDNQTYGGGYGLILVFDTQIALHYCYTSSGYLSKDCQKDQLKILIDCTVVDSVHPKTPAGQKKTTKNGQNQGSENNLPKIIFILVLTILPIIVLVLVGIYLIVRYQRSNIINLINVLVNPKTYSNLDKTKTSTSSGSSGSNSEKSVVKVLFKKEGWENE